MVPNEGRESIDEPNERVALRIAQLRLMEE